MGVGSVERAGAAGNDAPRREQGGGFKIPIFVLHYTNYIQNKVMDTFSRFLN